MIVHASRAQVSSRGADPRVAIFAAGFPGAVVEIYLKRNGAKSFAKYRRRNDIGCRRRDFYSEGRISTLSVGNVAEFGRILNLSKMEEFEFR